MRTSWTYFDRLINGYLVNPATGGGQWSQVVHTQRGVRPNGHPVFIEIFDAYAPHDGASALRLVVSDRNRREIAVVTPDPNDGAEVELLLGRIDWPAIDAVLVARAGATS